ncbi:sulfurtransferase TusA family protein [Solirubrobacter deserti]|uniref:Sulfurtransferase TusA family protein n=1 Tax=Solirubrobacter deserti TaxID=2282478 RepID=A0ABT4RNQ5_9ACTN|nr:sulfurtransferase TusA family protein [Solirubrobacter deserti]MDA0140201.1 sulfurtransferase TusA family protein [Solirubrobacter deserti]
MEVLVDARGLLCPLPVLRARAALGALAADDVLVVLATDREAPIDVGALAAQVGRPFSSVREAGVWRLVLGAVSQRPASPVRCDLG